jgi:heme A synthase
LSLAVSFHYIYFPRTAHCLFQTLIILLVPWLIWIVARVSPRRPGMHPRPVHVGFTVDKVTLGLVSEYFNFPLPVSFQYHSTNALLPYFIIYYRRYITLTIDSGVK